MQLVYHFRYERDIFYMHVGGNGFNRNHFDHWPCDYG